MSADAVQVDLQAALALAAAATDGPWFADGSEIYSEFPGGPWVGETCQADDPEKTEANAAFIAAARTLVPQLLAEVERLTKLTATCVCYDGNPANYEGPQVDCPVDGAVRAFNEATREIERLRPIVEAAREFGTLVLRGSWSEEQAAEFIAATQARGEVR